MQIAPERTVENDAVRPSEAGRVPAVASHGEALERLLPLVKRVVRSVGRRYRLRPDDIDDLLSTVCLKLLDERHAVLMRFEGRSAISTYLTTVVSRVWLDQRIAREGKWRPSAHATRLGATAVALERLIQREGLSVSEAIATVQAQGRTPAGTEELWRLVLSLPRRQGAVRFVSIDDVAELSTSAPPQATAHAPNRRRQVAAVLRELPPDDRMLLQRRFARGETVATIARSLCREQRELYRHYDRLFAGIRASVDARERPLTSRATAV